MKIVNYLKVCLVFGCVLVSISADKKKRGLYHGLAGYTVPLGVGFHRPYHPSPYAKFPGLHKGHGGVLPPGYALFPGSATVTSFHKNYPKIPAIYGSSYIPTYQPALGVSTAGFVRPVASFSPPIASVAPVSPVFGQSYPTFAEVPVSQAPTYVPFGNPQETSYFAAYPQKPLIPVAVPVPEKPKVPILAQRPFFTSFSNVLPSGVVPSGAYNPTVAVSNLSPTFVGVPIAGPTASTPTVTTASGAHPGQQSWRPVIVNHHHPTVTPATTTAFKPSLSLLPPYALPSNSQGQIYISSTPAPHIGDSQQQHQQTLFDLEQASPHHQNQNDGNGAFNGQPYDVASNHGRYTGPSSYDVDITHNGYQKK
ncbi:probable serine/threonine-protein kinase roco5 [Toxorhynchites rutilus septentrionalis]|uniref:probable serine/threonine-protein kinase roco5 n=1 Tax=Toxorhynchites rutilus septentrionalis TaxID=329112 RepID=UPI00247979F7|nr:probable serine/threonine-protein kinase roco5 [Toxorhynchites rutilus septentrionalis]